ncbi:unnamed protein product, partial [Protopolystoma xenopodis]
MRDYYQRVISYVYSYDSTEERNCLWGKHFQLVERHQSPLTHGLSSHKGSSYSDYSMAEISLALIFPVDLIFYINLLPGWRRLNCLCIHSPVCLYGHFESPDDCPFPDVMPECSEKSICIHPVTELALCALSTFLNRVALNGTGCHLLHISDDGHNERSEGVNA